MRHRSRSLQTPVILDGAEWTTILPAAVEHLDLKGKTESLALLPWCGSPHRLRCPLLCVLLGTAGHLALADQVYPVAALQKKKRHYHHLRGIPIQPFEKAHPLLPIIADYTYLIAAKEAVWLGPNGGPAAIHTELNWTFPASFPGTA